MRISDWSSDVCSSDLFDRNLFLEKRTELVAAKVSEFLRTTNRFAKTIIFCETTDHAERMRQALVNANADLAAANSKIGRASCRESVSVRVDLGGRRIIKKKKKKNKLLNRTYTQ